MHLIKIEQRRSRQRDHSSSFVINFCTNFMKNERKLRGKNLNYERKRSRNIEIDIRSRREREIEREKKEEKRQTMLVMKFIHLHLIVYLHKVISIHMLRYRKWLMNKTKIWTEKNCTDAYTIAREG